MVERILMMTVEPHGVVKTETHALSDEVLHHSSQTAQTLQHTPSVILDVVPASLEHGATEDCPECKPFDGLASLLKRAGKLASLLLPGELEIAITADVEPARSCERERCKPAEAAGVDCPRSLAGMGEHATRNDQPETVHVPCPECIRQVQLELVESEQEMHDDQCEGECDEDAAVFIEDVLRAQAQYLEEMMEARINHEREKLEIKSAAESALSKLTARHAEELARVRTEQAAELVRAKEEAWDFERKLLEAHHRQAIEHERELALLRREHMQELHAMRLASLESEIAMLRGATPTKSAAAGTATTEPSSQTSVRIGAGGERSIADASGSVQPVAPHVALSIGRVRSMPDRELDELQQTDFNAGTPPVPRPAADEIEQLRHEVARLRSLVDDLLCIGPGHPPTPVPQNASEGSSASEIVRDGLPILR
jgi:hypothetical protein